MSSAGSVKDAKGEGKESQLILPAAAVDERSSGKRTIKEDVDEETHATGTEGHIVLPAAAVDERHSEKMTAGEGADKEEHGMGKEGYMGLPAVALLERASEKMTVDQNADTGKHEMIGGEPSGTWGGALVPAHRSLSSPDAPMNYAPASPPLRDVEDRAAAEKSLGSHIQRAAPAATCPLSGSLCFRGDGESRQPDTCGGPDAQAFRSSSSYAGSAAASSLSPSDPPSARPRTNLAEEEHSSVHDATFSRSPSAHRRVWGGRRGNTHVSVCENCGTPFDPLVGDIKDPSKGAPPPASRTDTAAFAFGAPFDPKVGDIENSSRGTPPAASRTNTAVFAFGTPFDPDVGGTKSFVARAPPAASQSNTAASAFGTPFNSHVGDVKNFLEGVSPEASRSSNAAASAFHMRRLEVKQAASVIDERSRAPTLLNGGTTTMAPRIIAATRTPVAAAAVEAASGPAAEEAARGPAAAASALERAAFDRGGEENAEGGNKEGDNNDVRDSWPLTPTSTFFSSAAPSSAPPAYGESYTRKPKHQQQQRVLQQRGNEYVGGRFSRQTLPFSCLALFRRPCHVSRARSPASGGGATYSLLNIGGSKDVPDEDGEGSKVGSELVKQKYTGLSAASVPSEDGDAGNKTRGRPSAGSACLCEALSSPSLASSSSFPRLRAPSADAVCDKPSAASARLCEANSCPSLSSSSSADAVRDRSFAGYARFRGACLSPSLLSSSSAGAACDKPFAGSARLCGGDSSASLPSPSACSALCAPSAASRQTPPAPFAPSAMSATASPASSRVTGLKSKVERRRGRIRSCPSVSSTRATSSLAELTRAWSSSSSICNSSTCPHSRCAHSTCAGKASSRLSGSKCVRYCAASYLGFTWGWSFQRRPPASWRDYLGELKSGVGVALSQLPATMTCAIVANVPVTSALHGAWITGLITAILGGSPPSITTVTSSLAVTLAKVTRTVCDENKNTCTDEGLEFIFPALILAGAFFVLLGTLQLSRFSQFVPSATIVGYLNAVAILNVKAQVVTLKFDPVTSTGYEWLWVLLMITTVFIIMCTWEKIPKICVNELVPASVLALAVSSFIEFVLVRRLCGMRTKTVAALSTLGNTDQAADRKEEIPGRATSVWPKPFFRTPELVQPLDFYFRLPNLLTTAELTVALVMVNYMSTLITVDMLSDKSSHHNIDSKPDQHLVGVGLANMVACFLGALPGSTAPSPSLLNLRLGSRSREGAVTAALVNLAFVVASPYFLDVVPLGGLAGIIMYTAYHAFQWRAVAAIFASFLPERVRVKHPVLQRKICRSDAFVMLLTTTVALCADIGTAILCGVCIASCVFAWKNAARLQVWSRLDVEAGVKCYRVKGPIFFLTKRRLLRHFHVEKDPGSVILELSDEAEQFFDYGALETLDALVTRYKRANKNLKVMGMQCGDRQMIVRAGRLFEFAQIELVEKPLEEGANVKTIAEMMKLPC